MFDGDHDTSMNGTNSQIHKKHMNEGKSNNNENNDDHDNDSDNDSGDDDWEITVKKRSNEVIEKYLPPVDLDAIIQ